MPVLPDLATWSALSDAARERVCRGIAEDHDDLAFVAVRTHELAAISHRVGLFHRRENDGPDAAFVFVPGASDVRIGWEPSGWQPSPGLLASYDQLREEYGDDPDDRERMRLDLALPDYVDWRTTQPRTIDRPPLLVEVAAVDRGWLAVPPDDPAHADGLQRLADFDNHEGSHLARRRGGAVTLHEDRTQVRRDEAGNVEIVRLVEGWPDAVAARFADDGFRLPGYDEWESLCAAGAATLWRWGDDCPCDRYPSDVSVEEAAWRRRWVMSSGTLEYPADGFARTDTRHTRPNAFGLMMPADAYHCERLDDGRNRGGDGGCSACGGMGWLFGWLPLASAYEDEYIETTDLDADFLVFRRVRELA